MTFVPFRDLPPWFKWRKVASRVLDWAAQPIRLGLPGWHALTVRPLVLSPENVPLIADEAEAKRDVFLAAFSAMTHGRGPGAAAILKPLAAALETADTEGAGMLAQFVESCLGDAQARN
ncbi:hypothetical protein GCM10023084_75450 [Streptomyces lacrimifluminis]|uniref:Uncharacterized protein n=1 Tax=Streptomyces lacrimifluminis TaxID=1500077 RepID=A0A917P7Y2_9ACTN|nr:hypothetical protein GCM10012282_73930 [Streptomyces lacrimifluminis]